MTCPVTVSLGAYALGAADDREQLLLEGHLRDCTTCAEEMARLTPLARMLARLPASMIPGCELPEKPAKPRPRLGAMKTWQATAATAAALVIGAVCGFSLASHSTNPPVAAPGIAFSGRNPATHVRATAVLVATSWGTEIKLWVDGIPLNVQCRLLAVSAGVAEDVGAWSAWSDGPISVPASAAWHASDVTSLKIMAGGKEIATLTPTRR
jgi:hypothetical protein